jgi:chromosome segregation ATPase
MERKLEEKEKHIRYLYDELEEKEKDIEKLMKSLKDSKNLYQRQTDFAREAIEEKENLTIRLEDKEVEVADLKMKVCDKGCQKYKADAKHKEKLEALKEIAGSQKEKICCLRNHRNELFDKIDKLNNEHEDEVKKRDVTVAILQEENSTLKIKMSDYQEEIRVLDLKLEQLETSQSCHQELVSINDELKQANDSVEKEALVKENTILKDQVKDFERNKNKSMILLKEAAIHKQILEQKKKISSDLLKMKENEGMDAYRCYCRGFCRIFLHKHNWKASLSRKLAEKLESSSRYSCTICRKSLQSDDDLKKHVVNEHRNSISSERRKEIGGNIGVVP